KSRLEGRLEEVAEIAGSARAEAKAAREDERQRIASDFHDGPLQSFISLQMRLEIVRKLLERDLKAGMSELQVVQDLARSQVRELRAFLHSMRPVELDGANLSIAARRVIDNFQKESGIPVTLVGGDASLDLSEGLVSEVLQMLREALHNVQKHANASRVAVSIQKGSKLLEIAVDDNGRGFHFSGTYNLDELEMLQLGPASLKRRARSLNADLVLESRPGQGAGLKMRIPARMALFAFLVLTGCGRYADFTLPTPEGPARNVQFTWSSRPAPVLGRGAPGAFDSHDALNPAVVNRGGVLYNFYSGF